MWARTARCGSTGVAYSTLETSVTSAWPRGTLRTFVGFYPMTHEAVPEVYQFHIWIRQISPMIWRRLLVRSDSSLGDLHDIIQITFGWSDTHLHRFHIHGRDYGINRVGGLWFSHDARAARLDSFQFRLNERFLYEYDLRDSWQHQV